jgi:hypothetical protein
MKLHEFMLGNYVPSSSYGRRLKKKFPGPQEADYLK